MHAKWESSDQNFAVWKEIFLDKKDWPNQTESELQDQANLNQTLTVTEPNRTQT